MNSNTTDHERAARIRTARRRVDHIATAALSRIRQADRDTASMLDGYIAMLTAEANAYAAAADSTESETAEHTGTEADASSRAGLAAGARSGEHEIGGLSTRHPHTVGNIGIEGADLLD